MSQDKSTYSGSLREVTVMVHCKDWKFSVSRCLCMMVKCLYDVSSLFVSNRFFIDLNESIEAKAIVHNGT